MRGFYILAIATFAAFISGRVLAQTNTAAIPKRFLFIVETSSGTKAGAENAHKLLTTLIETGMGGLMETGDTFGFWTFNDRLHSGHLPMQRWAPETANGQALQIGETLKKQKFEKEPQMDPVLRPMFSVIQTSPTITVILVSSGKKPMQGTPFDRDINEFYKEHYRDFQKKKTPFVTMLLAQDGKVVRHSVSAALGDVKIPKPLPPVAPAPSTEQKLQSASPPLQLSPPTNAPAGNVSNTGPITSKALVISKSGVATLTGAELEKPPAAQAKNTNSPVATTKVAPSPATAEVDAAPLIQAPPPAVAQTNAPGSTLPTTKSGETNDIAKTKERLPTPGHVQLASVPSPAKQLEANATDANKVAPAPASPPLNSQPTNADTASQVISTKVAAAPNTSSPPSGETVPAIKPNAASAPATASEEKAATIQARSAQPVETAKISSSIIEQTSVKPVTNLPPDRTPSPALPAPTVVASETDTKPITQEKADIPVTAKTSNAGSGIAHNDRPTETQPPATRSGVNATAYLILGSVLVLVAIVIAFFIGRHTNRKPERSLITDWANQNSPK